MSTHHAHDLFDLIAERSDGWLMPQLEEAVSQKFGDTARFHTCSMEGLDLSEILQFALIRRKVELIDDRFYTGAHSCPTK